MKLPHDDKRYRGMISRITNEKTVILGASSGTYVPKHQGQSRVIRVFAITAVAVVAVPEV